MTLDDREALRARLAQCEKERQALGGRLAQCEKELATANQMIAQLQRDQKASEVAGSAVAITEFEDTFKRLVQRVAMILQAEKCVIMTLDRDSGELIARNPAFGMTESDIKMLRVKATEGIAGSVYRSEQPAIFHDAATDPRTLKQFIGLLQIRNGVIVPLIVEKRDDDNRIQDRVTIGVLCVFNKRYGGEFNEEDVRLLERLARNAAAVIANAQIFHDLVQEKEKLVHTIESLYAGLLLIAGNGKIMQMNARARQIFNVTSDPAGRMYRNEIGRASC